MPRAGLLRDAPAETPVAKVVTTPVRAGRISAEGVTEIDEEKRYKGRARNNDALKALDASVLGSNTIIEAI